MFVEKAVVIAIILIALPIETNTSISTDSIS